MRHLIFLLMIALFCMGNMSLSAQKKVGINTDNPSETLDIHKAGPGDTRTSLKLHSPNIGDTSSIILSTGNPTGNYAKYTISTTDMKMFIAAQSSSGNLDTILYVDENGELFLRNLSGANNEAVFVDAAGRLYSQPPPSGGSGGGSFSVTVNPNAALGTGSEFQNNISSNYSNMTSGSGSFIVPVELPGGATITNVTYYVYDNHQPIQVKCELWRRDCFNPNHAFVGFSITSPVGFNAAILPLSTSGNHQAVSTSNYFIKVTVEGGPWQSNNVLRFYGAKVSYTL